MMTTSILKGDPKEDPIRMADISPPKYSNPSSSMTAAALPPSKNTDNDDYDYTKDDKLPTNNRNHGHNNSDSFIFSRLPLPIRRMPPIPPPPPPPLSTFSLPPSVRSVSDDLWKCHVDDLARACHIMQQLRRSIFLEMNPDTYWSSPSVNRPHQQHHNNHHKKHLDQPFQIKVHFDPGEIFLSIQRTVLRFHSRWKYRLEKWKELQLKQTEAQQCHQNQNNADRENYHFQQDEELSWKLWEETMFTIAALAKECVGPAWRWQLFQRKNAPIVKRYKQSYRDKLRQDSTHTTDDSISTIGMASTTSAAKRNYTHNESLSGTNSSGEEDIGVGGVDGYGSASSLSVHSCNMTDFPNEPSADTFVAVGDSNGEPNAEIPLIESNGYPIFEYPAIPEVLPAAMIRFAASVSTTILESTRTMDSTVAIKCILNENGTDMYENNVCLPATSQYEPIYEDVISIVKLEQRQMFRRQRIGEAQRDLVIGLCCGKRYNNSNNQIHEGGNHHGTNMMDHIDWQWSNEWNSVGANAPIASMFVSWTETALTGWPMIRGKNELKPFLYTHDDHVNQQPLSYENNNEECTTKDQSANGITREVTLEGKDIIEKRNTKIETGKSEMKANPFEKVEIELYDASISEELKDIQIDECIERNASENQDNIGMGSDSSCILIKEKVPQHKYVKKQIERICPFNWSELVFTGPINWSYTIKVSKTISDLISIGWRPPTLYNQFGTESVMGLLAIIERGMNLQAFSIFGSPTDFKYESTATNPEARQERLTAITSSSECMSALAFLGSKGCIPSDSFLHLVTCLCRLLAAADSEISPSPCPEQLSPVECFDQSEFLFDENHTFLSQRECFLSDTAELLWLLIAHHKSARVTISALFNLMDSDFALLSAEVKIDEAISSTLACSGAIRALGAALWGNPPQVQGLQSLRIYWSKTIELFGKICASIFPEFSEKMQPSLISNLLLGIILEVAISLKRVVDGELIEGFGALTPHEWEAFIFTIEKGLLPWLDDYGYNNLNCIPKTVECNSSIQLSDKAAMNDEINEENSYINNHGSLRQRISNEVCDMCAQINFFLAKCASILGPNGTHYHHLIVDDSCRHRFHIMLLREACPVLPPLLASNLAVSVIRSWKSVGCFPYRGGSWTETASELLAYAFAVYDDPSHGFHGSCVHSPEVRLEALLSITYEAEHDSENSKNKSSLLVANSSDSSSISDSFEKSSQPDSPLFLTQHLRELHLELIRVLLPHLTAIASGPDSLEDFQKSGKSKVNNRGSHHQRNIILIHVHPKDNSLITSIKMARKNFMSYEYLLRKTAVQIIGQLFRSCSSEREYRASFIEILKNTALNGHSELPDDREIKESMTLRIEAVKQLELCLSAPFRALPFTHSCVPLIIQALCSITFTFGCAKVDDHRNREEVKERIHVNDIFSEEIRMILTCAAILPLARIRIGFHGNAQFLSRSKVLEKCPSSVLNFIKSYAIENFAQAKDLPAYCEESIDVDKESSSVSGDNISSEAPFLLIEVAPMIPQQTNMTSSKEISSGDRLHNLFGSSTTISINPILRVMCDLVHILSARMVKKDSRFASSKYKFSEENMHLQLIRSFIRLTCYEMFEASIQCDAKLSMDMNGDITIGKLLQRNEASTEDGQRIQEFIARRKAIVAYTGYLGRCLNLQKEHLFCYPTDQFDEKSNIRRLSLIFDLLKESLLSDNLNDVITGSHGVFILLTSITSKNKYSCSPEGCLDSDKQLSKSKETQRNELKWALESCKFITERLQYILCGYIRASKPVMHHVDTYELDGQKRIDVDPFVPLLSAMFDIYAVLKDTLIFEIPLKVRSLGFQICFNICCITDSLTSSFFSRQSQLLALHCAMFCISSVTSEEAKWIRQELEEHNFEIEYNVSLVNESSSSYILREEKSDDRSLKSILLESLNRRCDNNDFLRYEYPENSPHVHNAIENEEITAFPVDDHPFDVGNLEGCWLCENSILTLRAGHKKTRFRGWVELTLRSATTRLRRLVQLPENMFVQNPAFPSSLWSPPMNRNIQSNGRIIDECNSDVLLKARSVIDRFDILVGKRKGAKLTQHRFHKQESSNSFEKKYSSLGQEKDEGSSNNSIKRLNEKSFGEQECVSDESVPNMRRPFSESDLCSDDIEPRDVNVHTWLEMIFGSNSANLLAIENELVQIGLSRSMLGISNCSDQGYEKKIENEEKIQPLTVGPKLQRAINILDRTTHFQTHKVGLMFVRSKCTCEDLVNNNADRNDILKDKYGSPGFLEFAKEMGCLVLNRHLKYFSGGLDTSRYASDGEFTLINIWNDVDGNGRKLITGGTMMLFHVLPLMPQSINNRKKHVGNDYVHIMYMEETDENYNIIEQGGSVSGEFGFVTIYVIPFLQSGGMKVTVKIKSGLDKNTFSTLFHLQGTAVISKGPTAARYVRLVAARADLACRSIQEDRIGLFSNWEERLIQIRKMKRYVQL